MTDIKKLIESINSDFTTISGTVYIEGEKDIDVKDALKIIATEMDRLLKIEQDVNEKEDLAILAESLATKKEGHFSGVKTTETDYEGVTVEVYCDFWDFSGGTNTYYYTWEELRILNP